MFLSNRIFELFKLNKETFEFLQSENQVLKAERDALKSELLTTKANFEWLRVRCNGLEAQNAQFLEKVTGVRIPVPEIVRSTKMDPMDFNSDLFEDIGDVRAKMLGLPTYSDN